MTSSVRIGTAVDVGAHHGEWYRTFKNVYPETDVLSFEANPEAFSVLEKVNKNSRLACLSDKIETRKLFLPDPAFSSLDTGVSLYKENLHYYNSGKYIQVTTTTLNAFGQHFNYMKLDVQGAELDVLRGASRTIATASFIQVEVSLLRHNQGTPLAAAVIAFLHSLGFEILDLTEIMVLGGRLNQMDLLFARRSQVDLFDVPTTP